MKKTKLAKTGIIFAISFMLLVLPACDWSLLSEILGMGCEANPDSAHCYQAAATQSGQDEECEKIVQPEQFKSVGSNPPKDKCYLIIAQNTGNPNACKQIKGGMYSYTQEECFTDVAVATEDPNGCDSLSGSDLANCRSKVGALMTPEKLTNLNTQLDDAKKRLRDDPNDPDTQAEIKSLEEKKNSMLGVMTQANKDQYFKENREEIMSGIEDDDVKSEVAKAYTEARKADPNMNVEQLVQKLKDIKEEKETMKRLDDEANQLVDTLKGTIGDYADEKKQEAIDAMTEKGWDYMKKNGGDNLKWGLYNLEKMKEKYDKASEQYDKINSQIEKVKKTYDEMQAIYKKVDQFNKMLADGKIDQGQAKVLKGAVMLGKGLEYATQYVPVFGSTASTITKETFDATVKLATKRAQRTNSLQKCIDDPEHCDPSGISAY